MRPVTGISLSVAHIASRFLQTFAFRHPEVLNVSSAETSFENVA